jgi:FkbM family methyltransferase
MDKQLLKLRLHRLAVTLLRPTTWLALKHRIAAPAEHLGVLRTLSVDGIIDVGANKGQFTLACRLVLPGVPIVAFEPIPSEAATFRKVHGKFANVTLIESALGETNGRATLHLSRSADSSSLLPIGRRQIELFQHSVEVGTMEVVVQRLDNLATLWPQRIRQLLKLDVQGFELNVLRGAVETLQSCSYVYAECSEVALYEGQALRAEVAAFLKENGFGEPILYNPYFDDQGQLVQGDYLFARR